MRPGYLILEADPAFPGVVRLRGVEEAPAEFHSPLTYIARFADLDTALMHFHGRLARRLIDVNIGLYRVTKGQAAAVAEAIELPHRRVYLDPQLADSPEFRDLVERLNRMHRLRSWLFDWVGIIALLALFAVTLVGL